MNFSRTSLINFFERSIEKEFDYKKACLQISVGASRKEPYEVTAWSREGINLKRVISSQTGYLSAEDSSYWELLSIRRKIPVSDNGFKCIILEIE